MVRVILQKPYYHQLKIEHIPVDNDCITDKWEYGPLVHGHMYSNPVSHSFTSEISVTKPLTTWIV